MVTFLPKAVNPNSLEIIGSIQPYLTRSILDSMVEKMQGGKFDWEKAKENDGPIEIWEIEGRRYLANGNHRYRAAQYAGINIPSNQVVVVHKGQMDVPTFLHQNMNIID